MAEENIYYFTLFFINYFKHNYIQQNFDKTTIFHGITQLLFVENQL